MVTSARVGTCMNHHPVDQINAERNVSGMYQKCIRAILPFSLYLNDLKELLNELIYAPYVYDFYAYHCFLQLTCSLGFNFLPFLFSSSFCHGLTIINSICLFCFHFQSCDVLAQYRILIDNYCWSTCWQYSLYFSSPCYF